MIERISSLHESLKASLGKDPKVIVPDVFPSASNPRTNLLGLHDIIRGHVPSENDFQSGQLEGLEGFNQGWLRVAYATPRTPAYIDPADGEARDSANLWRPCKNIPIEYDQVKDIDREELPLSTALKAFGSSFSRPDLELFTSRKQVEMVRSFSGKIAINGISHRAIGVHVPSGKQHGWVKIWGEH
jgi:hypothetical protein